MIGNPVRWQEFTGSFPVVGEATAPAAGTVIADTGALPAGVYRVQVSGSYSGVASTIDNMQLNKAGVFVTKIPVIPAVDFTWVPLDIPAVVVYQGQHLTVSAIAAGAGGTVFRATIVATPIQTQDF